MDSDTQIYQDVVGELKNSPVLHYARLSLSVENGVVTITGRVNTLSERRSIERAANRVPGIRTLILEIGASLRPVTVVDTQDVLQKDIAQKGFA